MKTEAVAMILAGGQGSRVGKLTKQTAKPAVSFGGNYRIIDFALSNCANSRINTVEVVTQSQPLVLNERVGNGVKWVLDRQSDGATSLQPSSSIDGEKLLKAVLTLCIKIWNISIYTMLNIWWFYQASIFIQWTTKRCWSII